MIKIFSGLAPFLLVPSLPAQTDLSLSQAVDAAVGNNREVAALRLEVKKLESEVAVAKTYRLPQFRVNAFGFVPLTNINFTFPAGAFGSFPTTGPIPPLNTVIGTPRRFSAIVLAGADQPLSQFHRIHLGVQLQDLNRQLALEKVREKERAIANQAKGVYFDIVEAISALSANQEAQKLYAELERVAQEGLNQQVILPADLLDVQTRIAEAQLDQITLSNAIRTRKSQLNVLMGRNLDTDFEVIPVTEIADLETDAASARARALDQRAEVREARLKVRQADTDRELKRAEFIPDVNLSANYLGLGNVSVVPSQTVAVGVTLSWTPFDWHRKKLELGVKSHTAEEARLALSETEAQISLAVDARRRALEEGRARLKVSDLARRAARERLRVALDRQGQQAAQLKETLQYQAALADASFRYQKDVLTLGKAKAEFEKAVGDQ